MGNETSKPSRGGSKSTSKGSTSKGSTKTKKLKAGSRDHKKSIAHTSTGTRLGSAAENEKAGPSSDTNNVSAKEAVARAAQERHEEQVRKLEESKKRLKPLEKLSRQDKGL